jgi:hypothetical protein
VLSRHDTVDGNPTDFASKDREQDVPSR